MPVITNHLNFVGNVGLTLMDFRISINRIGCDPAFIISLQSGTVASRLTEITQPWFTVGSRNLDFASAVEFKREGSFNLA
jgi:hypothetical protein